MGRPERSPHTTPQIRARQRVGREDPSPLPEGIGSQGGEKEVHARVECTCGNMYPYPPYPSCVCEHVSLSRDRCLSPVPVPRGRRGRAGGADVERARRPGRVSVGGALRRIDAGGGLRGGRVVALGCVSHAPRQSGGRGGKGTLGGSGDRSGPWRDAVDLDASHVQFSSVGVPAYSPSCRSSSRPRRGVA